MNNNFDNKIVDIIIPIYNAYEELTICLESIYKNTDLFRNRLILINDNSPDIRIQTYLEQQKQTNVIVIHNEKNEGFSNSINIGMSQSRENDVVLLNSDTVVTERWIEKILRCAYSDDAIGTVTPVSNNATLCSVPKFCAENVLPNYIKIEQAGEIVERCSMKKYPRITTANGYCMFVKREVINLIGDFDAKTFERGYGEENDFCNRAEQVGYCHVMCDDTYIYHSGTKSFVSKEKEKYILLHDKILRECYPDQMHLNDIHVRDNPNSFVGENIGIYFDLENGKKNILYIVHSDFRKGAIDNIGGTQFHVRDLMLGLRDKYNIFVAARNGKYLNLTAYYGKKEKTFRFSIGEKNSLFEFRSRILEKLWKNILSAFHIDLVHVHHVSSLSFDIFYVSKEYNIPIVLTVHDFFFVCPTIKMLNIDGVVCAKKDGDLKCKECLNRQMGITDKLDYIEVWRNKCTDILKDCRLVIIPDESAANILLFYYPFLEDKLKVIAHGYNVPKRIEYEVECSNEIICKYERVEKEGFFYKIVGWSYLKERQGNTGEKIYVHIWNKNGMEKLVPATKRKRLDVIAEDEKSEVGYICFIPQGLLDGGSIKIRVGLEVKRKLIYAMEIFETPPLPQIEKKLNIAFIGGLNKAKGGEIIYEIIKSFKENINWYIFGSIGEENLAVHKQKNLMKIGNYMPEDLSGLLSMYEIDVVGILSIWPETYSYTLTEAILNRIPVITTDIGALGRRVKEMNCGWTISVDFAKEDFLKIIRGVLKDKSCLKQYKRTIERIQIPTIMQMANKYQQVYEGLWSCNNTYQMANYEEIYEGYMNEKEEYSSVYCDKSGGTNVVMGRYFRFKRYLQNNHLNLYIFLRKTKNIFCKH